MKYRSRTEFQSRLARQEAKRFTRQAILMVIITLAIMGLIIIFGIPAMIKLAIFLGDIRNSTTPIENQDKIPPATPQLSTPPVATSSAQISLSGFAEPGSTVMVYLNGSKVGEMLVDNQGTFSLPDLNLSEGANRFYAVAVDTTGNESQKSNTQTTNLDTKAPEISITSPLEAQKFFGLNEQMITITGATDPDANVTVNGQHLVVDPSGNFTSRFQLSEGDNEILIKAVDTAGNNSEKKVKVNWSK